MHLYTQSASPNGRRVNVFMKEKGIDIEKTEIDLRAAENLSEDYRQKNPFGRVPVLELDDGSFLAESQAICLYLEGLHPTPNLFGETPEEKAKIEMWSRRVELNVLMPVAQAFRNITGFFKDREKIVPEWGEVSAEAARHAVGLINEHLASSQYLARGSYSVADMNLAIVLGFARNVGQDLLEAEHIARWYAEITSRPAFG
ncbi:MAG: glutathione S-transferase family protein [Gammaproteobacteria bacterium]|nr:glutathione S-transferase family protein [Gammaproteobacteria bacterium]